MEKEEGEAERFEDCGPSRTDCKRTVPLYEKSICASETAWVGSVVSAAAGARSPCAQGIALAELVSITDCVSSRRSSAKKHCEGSVETEVSAANSALAPKNKSFSDFTRSVQEKSALPLRRMGHPISREEP